MSQVVKDIHGNTVAVGDRVRVLAIPPLDSELETGEVARVNSMLGEEFDVYEIDAYGRVWVEKWWGIETGSSTSHSLALDSTDMERIDGRPKS
jgi:hypothetical protein